MTSTQNKKMFGMTQELKFNNLDIKMKGPLSPNLMLNSNSDFESNDYLINKSAVPEKK